MRQDCRHYESRTYANGEMVRKCKLDLAPEAPWRCPDNCPRYERRMGDAGWSHGSLVSPPSPEEPAAMTDDVATLLDQAEDIINTVGPSIMAEVDRQREGGRGGGPASWWKKRKKRSR